MEDRPEDKRKTPRVPVDFSVSFIFESKEHEARALNLSPDGMFVATDVMLLQNDNIEIFFHLPGVKEPLWMKARVAWGSWVAGRTTAVSISGMGVQFLDPLAAQKEAIETYLQQLMNP